MTNPLSHRVRVDTGLELHVLEWGSERPGLQDSVFLAHGFLDLAWGWQEVVQAGLAERFHVVAYDVRGHGDSDRVGPGGYYYFMDYVADLTSLVERLARKRVCLVGHSMGGNIVSYYAGTYPERVERLALLEGVGPPEDSTPMPERLKNWVAGLSRTQTRESRAYATLEDAARRLQRHDSLLDAELALRLAEHGTRLLADGRRVFKHDLLHLTRGPIPFRVAVAAEFWQRITCPVLLLEGSESIFRLLPDREARCALFRNARSRTIEGAGHMMQRHRPAEVAKVLLNFLA